MPARHQMTSPESTNPGDYCISAARGPRAASIRTYIRTPCQALLETIEGLRRPDSGTVTVLGQSVRPRNSALLPRIGVQLQASSFFERLTAREQIHTFASLYGVGGKAADTGRSSPTA
jgi:hypothetical protein